MSTAPRNRPRTRSQEQAAGELEAAVGAAGVGVAGVGVAGVGAAGAAGVGKLVSASYSPGYLPVRSTRMILRKGSTVEPALQQQLDAGRAAHFIDFGYHKERPHNNPIHAALENESVSLEDFNTIVATNIARINELSSSGGWTPLRLAAHKGKAEHIKVLFKLFFHFYIDNLLNT